MTEGIGVCFTHEHWCRWLLQRYGVLEAWLQGETICDPTAGQGAFILALCQMAVEAGHLLMPDHLKRLHLIEINPAYLQEFTQQFRACFGLSFPKENLHCCDVILSPPELHCDRLVGNPPWVNFADLPPEYKETLKPYFLREGLAGHGPSLLLGCSRIDLSALILNVALGRLLKPQGRGCFYLPQSLFFGEGAHEGFRRFHTQGRSFCIQELCDFDASLTVFPGIGTAYCAADIRLDAPQQFPVPLATITPGVKTADADNGGSSSQHLSASTSYGETTTWLVPQTSPFSAWHPQGNQFVFNYPLRPDHRARQGVNTCGCNEIFIFDSLPEFLDQELMYPLISKLSFSEEHPEPRRWILLPHHPLTGKPLAWEDIPQKTRSYLLSHRENLENRRGQMLQTQIKRGYWWSLLGVGPYSFTPCKVVWEAFGQKRFTAKVFDNVNGKPWQGNQALHAFMPCSNLEEASALSAALNAADITEQLRAMRSSGKCNWAQPGKLWKLLTQSSKIE